MSFLIKDDEVWDRYDNIWDAIKINQALNFIANLFMNIDT